jgi:hypothetical protein
VSRNGGACELERSCSGSHLSPVASSPFFLPPPSPFCCASRLYMQQQVRLRKYREIHTSQVLPEEKGTERWEDRTSLGAEGIAASALLELKLQLCLGQVGQCHVDGSPPYHVLSFPVLARPRPRLVSS